MSKFWELLKESVIVQSLVTLILISTICVLFLRDGKAPVELLQITYLVVGYYFGAKIQHILSLRK